MEHLVLTFARALVLDGDPGAKVAGLERRPDPVFVIGQIRWRRHAFVEHEQPGHAGSGE